VVVLLFPNSAKQVFGLRELDAWMKFVSGEGPQDVRTAEN